MKIPKDTMRRLQLAKMLLESVEESLEKYDKAHNTACLKKEDSVGAVHRRLVQARQELAKVGRDFDDAQAFQYRQNFYEEENKNGKN